MYLLLELMPSVCFKANAFSVFANPVKSDVFALELMLLRLLLKLMPYS
jgi:hypothetical protein